MNNNDSKRAELQAIIEAIDKHNYFVIIEDYSIIKRQFVFSVYSRTGTRYYLSRTDCCYPITDNDVYDHIYNVLIEELKISLNDVAVFIPTHAASLIETFRYNDLDCLPYYCDPKEIVGMAKATDCMFEFFGGAYL